MIEPRIVSYQERLLIGVCQEMSLVDNQTAQLWRSFMPRRSEIGNVIGGDLISMQVFDADHFKNFSPANRFVKWAAVEVTNHDLVPEGMWTFIIPEGEWAVFDYKGSSSDPSIFQFIYSQWLPKSGFQLDSRPHFEVLSEKYKNNDPNSEEEIWIPIKAS
ncbi:MAG: GyrI-like domain-containing protein [Cyclobacteriaceae bacterium]